jgi:hypothetical protein
MKKVRELEGGAGERGAISIKVVITLLLLGSAAFAVVKIAPVYIEQQQVLKEADDLARKAAMGLSVYSGDKIRKEIERIRQEYDLPEGSMNLASQTDGRAQITIKYTRPIDFLVTTYPWEVDKTVEGRGL